MQRGNPVKLNFEDLEMQKSNVPTDGTQRVDKLSYLLSAIVIKMSKMAYSLYFLLMTTKSVTVWEYI